MSRRRGYRELAEHLRDLAKRMDPGDRLPPEQALADEFGTTRSTASHAYDVVIAEGVAEQIPGRKGYFVAARSDVTWRMALREDPWRDSSAGQPTDCWVTVRITRDEQVGAASAREELHLSPDDQLLLVRETVMCTDVYVMLSRSYLPYDLVKNTRLMDENPDVDLCNTLCAAMVDQVTSARPRIVDRLRARPASEDEREALQMAPGFIVEVIRRYVFGDAHDGLHCYAIEQFLFPATAEFEWVHQPWT